MRKKWEPGSGQFQSGKHVNFEKFAKLLMFSCLSHCVTVRHLKGCTKYIYFRKFNWNTFCFEGAMQAKTTLFYSIGLVFCSAPSGCPAANDALFAGK